jgi:uncharacterized membrane-anchored protein
MADDALSVRLGSMAGDFLSMCAGIGICVGIMAGDALSMCVGVSARIWLLHVLCNVY